MAWNRCGKWLMDVHFVSMDIGSRGIRMRTRIALLSLRISRTRKNIMAMDIPIERLAFWSRIMPRSEWRRWGKFSTNPSGRNLCITEITLVRETYFWREKSGGLQVGSVKENYLYLKKYQSLDKAFKRGVMKLSSILMSLWNIIIS